MIPPQEHEDHFNFVSLIGLEAIRKILLNFEAEFSKYTVSTTIDEDHLGLRLLLLNGVSVESRGSTYVEQLVDNTPLGTYSAAKCDIRTHKKARAKRKVFSFLCHNGLQKFAFPLHIEDRYVGVIISKGFRPRNFEDRVPKLATRYELSEDLLYEAFQKTPEASHKFLRFVEPLAVKLFDGITAALHVERLNAFLEEALKQRELESLLQFLVDKTPALIWGTHCSVFLWDAPKGRFVLARTSCPTIEDLVGKEGYKPGEGLTGWVGQHNRPILVADVRDDTQLAKYEEADIPRPVWSGKARGSAKISEGDVAHIMIVPIADPVTGAPVGVIRLAPQGRESQKPEDRHLQLFIKIGQAIAGVVQNAKLTDSLLNMANALGAFNVDDGLQALLDEVARVSRSFSAHIRIRVQNPQEDVWLVLVTSGPHSQEIEGRKAVPTGELVSPIMNGEPYYLGNDVQKDEQFRAKLAREREIRPDYALYMERIGATLIVPLHDPRRGSADHKSVPIGILNLHRPQGERFEMDDVKQIQRLVPALETMVAHLKVADRKRGEDAASQHLDLRDPYLPNRQSLLDQIVNSVQRLVNADVALYRELEKDESNPVIFPEKVEVEGLRRLKLAASVLKAEAVVPGKIPSLYYIGEEGSGKAAETKQTYYLSDAQKKPLYVFNPQNSNKWPRSDEEVQFLSWIKSEVAVPILAFNSLVGVIVVIGHKPNQFGQRDVDVLEGFADRLSLVLHSAKLAEREAQIRFQAWKEVSAQAAHRVGNRVDAVDTLLIALQNRLIKGQDTSHIIENLLPRVRASVQDAKQFLLQFRQFALSRPLHMQSVDLRILLDAALEQDDAFRDGTDFSQWDDALPPVRCDVLELKHCFAEIFTNAREAGASHLQVSSRAMLEDGEVELSICNNGRKLLVDQENSVFEPLYTTKSNGTGLGLSMVRQIVQAHGGTIQLEPDAKGVCVSIRLPIKPD